MPILYVNPARRGRRKKMRISGRAKIGASRARRKVGRKSKRKGRMPKALAAYWAKKRGRKSRRSKRSKKSRRRARRSTKEKQMPRRRKRRSARKSRRRSRRRGRKRVARKGRRKTRRRSRRRGRKRVARKSRRKSRRRTRRRSRRKSRRKSRRRGRRRARRSSKRRARRKRRKSPSRRRTRRYSSRTLLMGGAGRTIKMNPSRRRRRRRSRRRGRRGRRRVQRRYSRGRYRRNPGGMLIDLAKRAAPVLIGLYGARMIVSKLGPRVPGVARLGTFQGPALAIGAVLLVHFATKKIGKLAKYRNELLLGTGLNALDSLVSTFAPASVKGLIGAGDVYQALGDYYAMPGANNGGMGDYLYAGGGGPPIDDNLSMGDYVSIGDVEQELGMVEQELGMMGVEEDLGGELVAPVPTVPTLAPVPDRSFVRPVPTAGENYDNPALLYRGIFAN